MDGLRRGWLWGRVGLLMLGGGPGAYIEHGVDVDGGASRVGVAFPAGRQGRLVSRSPQEATYLCVFPRAVVVGEVGRDDADRDAVCPLDVGDMEEDVRRQRWDQEEFADDGYEVKRVDVALCLSSTSESRSRVADPRPH